MKDKRRVVSMEDYVIAVLVRDIMGLVEPTEVRARFASLMRDRREFHEFRIESKEELRTYRVWSVLRNAYNWVYTELNDYRSGDYTARIVKVNAPQPNGTYFKVVEGGAKIELQLQNALLEVDRRVAKGRAELCRHAPTLGPLLIQEDIDFRTVSQLVAEHHAEALTLVKRFVPPRMLKAMESAT